MSGCEPACNACVMLVHDNGRWLSPNASHVLLLPCRVVQTDTVTTTTQQNGVAQQEQAQQSRETFTWTRTWYPVIPIDHLDPCRPYPVTLLGKDLVVWKDGAGEWRCFQDACPHR